MFPLWGCAQARRKASPDSRPAVGERIRQYSTFQTIRLNGTKTYCSPRRSVHETRPGELFLARSCSRVKSEVPGLQMEGKVLSVACPSIWSGRLPVLFCQAGSGERELPGRQYSPPTNATLCRRFSSLRPAQIHIGGYSPGIGGSRIIMMVDKHKQIRPNTNESDLFPGRQVQSSKEGICIKVMPEKPRRLKKGFQRVIRKRMASARVIASIASQCITMAKVIMPAKLCLWSLYRLLRRKNKWRETMVLPGDCLGDLEWWYKNVEFWNCGILHSQPITIQVFTDASDSGSAGELASMATAFGLWDRVTAHQSINFGSC